MPVVKYSCLLERAACSECTKRSQVRVREEDFRLIFWLVIFVIINSSTVLVVVIVVFSAIGYQNAGDLDHRKYRHFSRSLSQSYDKDILSRIPASSSIHDRPHACSSRPFQDLFQENNDANNRAESVASRRTGHFWSWRHLWRHLWHVCSWRHTSHAVWWMMEESDDESPWFMPLIIYSCSSWRRLATVVIELMSSVINIQKQPLRKLVASPAWRTVRPYFFYGAWAIFARKIFRLRPKNC